MAQPRSFSTSLEITPPARANATVLLRRARALDPLVDDVNVIDRDGRLSSLECAGLLADAGIRCTWNLRTRGRSRAEVERDLAHAADQALDRVVCVRGERGARDREDTPRLHEVIERARSLLPGAEIGATLNPYAAGDRVQKNLFAKLAAGATFVQTNLVFGLDDLDAMAEPIRAAFPDVRILVMVRPFADAEEASRVASRVGAQTARDPRGPVMPIGPAAFRELVDQVARSPLYAGVTLMTPRMDLDPVEADALRAVLARGVALGGARRDGA